MAGLTRTQQRNDLVLAAVLFLGGLTSAVLSSVSGIYGDQQGSLAIALGYVAVLAIPIAFGIAGLSAVGEARADATAIAFGGDASPRERELAASTFMSTARRSGWPFVKHAFTAGETAKLKACFTQASPWTCASPARRASTP